MLPKLKSFKWMALLFVPLLMISAQVKPTTESLNNKSWSVSDLDGKWYLQIVSVNDSSNNRAPEILFDIKQNRFSGTTGCNQMSGSFIATDSTLHISDKMITTRMFCPGYDELSFLQNLLKIDGYHFKNGRLILTSKNDVISQWSRKKLTRI
ncbi:MAG TPA: META domain-containing protein [Puia sp.]|jgi:heat shock protein HslJ|nr:META domain-containing protein [Puia sp.]